MISYTEIDSPVGRLLLKTDGIALTGIYFDMPGRSPGEIRRAARHDGRT